jgi:hypothetical protein
MILLSTLVESSNRSLIDTKLWTRLVNRIVKDENISLELAEESLDQALGFLKRCANGTGGNVPTPLEDIGWHTFILYTREYAEFCYRIAGRFIHHSPTDEDGVESTAQCEDTCRSS